MIRFAERGGAPIDFQAVADTDSVAERGQISAPGTFASGAVIVPEAARVPDEPLDELAARHGLKLSGARPSLARYLNLLWQRRHFILGYATARNVSMYTEARLGQLWQVLTPLLNAGVYYLIFGLLFQANRGVRDYIGFLVAGVFIFAFTERSIVTGSNVMRTNLQLIRALYFPRASLPLAYVLVELQQTLLSMLVLFAIMLGTGQPLTLYWLLMVPVLVLQAMFNTGAALIVARMGGSVQDVGELIPFLLRISRYFCGVMYMVTTLPAKIPQWALQVLTLNPAAVYISLVRVSLMRTYREDAPGNQPYNAAKCDLFHKNPGKYGHLQPFCHAIATNPDLWFAAVGWGVAFLVVGVVFFWQAESKYGRG